MPESGTSGSVRGVPGNGHPYRDQLAPLTSLPKSPARRQHFQLPLNKYMTERRTTLATPPPRLHRYARHSKTLGAGVLKQLVSISERMERVGLETKGLAERAAIAGESSNRMADCWRRRQTEPVFEVILLSPAQD